MHICPLCCRTAAGWHQGKDELKGLFQLNVSIVNLQTTHPKKGEKCRFGA